MVAMNKLHRETTRLAQSQGQLFGEEIGELAANIDGVNPVLPSMGTAFHIHPLIRKKRLTYDLMTEAGAKELDRWIL